MAFCIPFALVGFLRFYTPFDANTFSCGLYIALVVIIFNIFQTFANTANYVAYVITPNEKERNGLMSKNSFFASIMASAPLVIVVSGKDDVNAGLASSYMELMAESMGLVFYIADFLLYVQSLVLKLNQCLNYPKVIRWYLVWLLDIQMSNTSE